MRLVTAAAVVLLALAAGCSDDGDDGDGVGTVPQCSAVWVEGATLPADYEGCEGSGGVLVLPELQPCDDGDRELTYFEDRLYAVLGETIMAFPGDDDPNNGSQTSYIISC